MKNRSLILLPLVVLAAITLGITVFISYIKQPCPPPVKLNNIPTSAFWVGGCDGGLWYELLNRKDSIYTFKIYNDFNGQIVSEGDFRTSGKCYEDLKNQKIQDLITHSTVDKIYVITNVDGKYCYLERVK